MQNLNFISKMFRRRVMKIFYNMLVQSQVRIIQTSVQVFLDQTKVSSINRASWPPMFLRNELEKKSLKVFHYKSLLHLYPFSFLTNLIFRLSFNFKLAPQQCYIFQKLANGIIADIIILFINFIASKVLDFLNFHQVHDQIGTSH